MAVLFYPKDQILARRDASNPMYEQLTLATNPDMFLYFDTASNANAISSSLLYLTSSWALTASVTILFASNSLSSSYASTSSRSDTASFALNAGTAGGSSLSSTGSLFPYLTVVSSSTNWITASFQYAEQSITVNSGAVYSFTCSNMPSANTASNLSLYISNIGTVTSSLTFPSNWVFIGIVPTYMTASKSAILSLKALGNQVIAAWGSQY